MKKVILIVVIAMLFSGCTGIITGHEYNKKDFVVAYKVVRKGVAVFMTEDQIRSANLNTVNDIVTDTYKIIEGNGAR